MQILARRHRLVSTVAVVAAGTCLVSSAPAATSDAFDESRGSARATTLAAPIRAEPRAAARPAVWRGHDLRVDPALGLASRRGIARGAGLPAASAMAPAAERMHRLVLCAAVVLAVFVILLGSRRPRSRS